MPLHAFRCFYTFFKGARAPVPFTAGYDAPGATARLVKAHAVSPVFLHSGNWWTIPPGKRTRAAVLDGQLAMVNGWTAGLMSMNVEPGDDPLAWVNVVDPAAHDAANATCLANATWARDEVARRGIDVPVYCTLQPASATMARDWFGRAVAGGHEHLCMGVSGLLRAPKHRARGTALLLEMVHEARRALGPDRGAIHLSGLMSPALLPVVAALGATSTDGSTPVQSALAYGTVYTPDGKGIPAHKLAAPGAVAAIPWTCECPGCASRTVEETFVLMQDRVERVRHNLETWERLVRRINEDVIPDPRRWFDRHGNTLPAATRAVLARALAAGSTAA